MRVDSNQSAALLADMQSSQDALSTAVSQLTPLAHALATG